MNDAEITRLRAERDELLRALKAIQTAPRHANADWPEIVDWMCAEARAAIAKAEEKVTGGAQAERRQTPHSTPIADNVTQNTEEDQRWKR